MLITLARVPLVPLMPLVPLVAVVAVVIVAPLRLRIRLRTCTMTVSIMAGSVRRRMLVTGSAHCIIGFTPRHRR